MMGRRARETAPIFYRRDARFRLFDFLHATLSDTYHAQLLFLPVRHKHNHHVASQPMNKQHYAEITHDDTSLAHR